jgi:hypothetical protein
MMTTIDGLWSGVRAGRLIPYLGPGALALCEGNTPPADAAALVARLTARSSVPGKIRHKLTASAQFIENFKHRKTLVAAMDEAFTVPAAPSALHRAIAEAAPPLVVNLWYDDTMRRALQAIQPADRWGEVQGLSQSEHFGRWAGVYDSAGQALDAVAPPWKTLLYSPWGSCQPASNYLVSDSDFVEVLTEIDIQTPIPEPVQRLRASRGFVFIGCRFDDQLTRAYARQILKRSAGPHVALLANEPTRMEARFLEEQRIERLPLDAAALLEAPLATLG